MFCLIFANIVSFYKMFFLANSLSPFFDEEVYNDSATQFFRTLEYKTYRAPFSSDARPIDARAGTNGIMNTWPSGLALALGGNRLTARMVQALATQLFFFLLVYLFLKRNSYSSIGSIAVASVVWLFLLRLPYWHGFIINLGELPSAIWMGFGFLFIYSNPFVSSVFFGIAVWLGKFFYFPYSILLLMAIALIHEGDFKQKLTLFFKCNIGFFLPLVLWFLFILIRTDWGVLKIWLVDFNYLVFYSGSTKMTNSIGFSERLATLEWSDYTLGTKGKILFFLFVPPVMIAVEWMRNSTFLNKRNLFLIMALFLGIILNCIYYFFLHPVMWIRYLQPALYLSFGLFFFILFQWIKDANKQVKVLPNILVLIALAYIFLEAVLLIF